MTRTAWPGRTCGQFQFRHLGVEFQPAVAHQAEHFLPDRRDDAGLRRAFDDDAVRGGDDAGLGESGRGFVAAGAGEHQPRFGLARR